MTDTLSLGIPELDETHDEFIALLDTAKRAEGPKLLAAFGALIHHTEAHFAMEESLMRERGFYGMQEHLDEHGNLLGEMRYFYAKAHKAAAFGRAYIHDYAFEKFRRHIINIDSQFAMFLKQEAAHA